MLAASILLTPGTEVSGKNKAEKTETAAVKTEPADVSKDSKDETIVVDKQVKISSEKVSVRTENPANQTSVKNGSSQLSMDLDSVMANEISEGEEEIEEDEWI